MWRGKKGEKPNICSVVLLARHNGLKVTTQINEGVEGVTP